MNLLTALDTDGPRFVAQFVDVHVHVHAFIGLCNLLAVCGSERQENEGTGK